MNFRYAEFFSGGGMVSQALHSDWDCVLANDICAKKNASYKINSPHPDVLCEISISDLAGHDIPKADLFWASFPCQDLSVAGKQQGLRGKRSGLFYEFWRVVRDYTSHNLPPSIVAFENVLGTLRSNAGQDIIEIQNEFERNGYVFGYLTLDAKQFLPQSRPRLFGIGVRKDLIIPTDLIAPGKVKLGSLINWREPKINPRFPVSLEGIVEEYPTSNDWYSTSQVAKLISMMSKINLAKLERAKASKTRQIGFVYKRTRIENGQKIQRADLDGSNVEDLVTGVAGAQGIAIDFITQ
ncbi:MAG: DNA cytosine methyltransferase, partial [Planktomarina sp.]